MKTDFYIVNLDQILARNDLWEVVQGTAIKIKYGTIATMQDFLRGLSDDDLGFFMSQFDKFISKDKIVIDSEEALQNIIVLSIMLGTAEGVPPESMEEIELYCRQVPGFITLESLARKGMITLKYENISLGEDYAKKVVAERVL